MEATIERLRTMQRLLRDAVRRSLLEQSAEMLARRVRDDAGDTIFGIDVAAEEVLLPFCQEWGKQQTFLLIAEGLEPDTGVQFGSGTPEFRLIVDPIDGTRGLMYDKRSAWALAAVADDKGDETRLSDVRCAVMTELPTTRQATSDVLWAARGTRAFGARELLADGSQRDLPVVPTQATDFLHGFATVANFFQGGKELTARFEEDLLRRERGGWNSHKAEIYTDQYISSGGQLAELALGRDRFVLDIRPLVHEALGIESTLCSRPYDLCTALVAQAAGCIVEAPDGTPLDPPLDVTTNVSFAGYANASLHARVAPMVRAALTEHGLA